MKCFYQSCPCIHTSFYRAFNNCLMRKKAEGAIHFARVFWIRTLQKSKTCITETVKQLWISNILATSSNAEIASLKQRDKFENNFYWNPTNGPTYGFL